MLKQKKKKKRLSADVKCQFKKEKTVLLINQLTTWPGPFGEANTAYDLSYVTELF